MSIVDFTCRYSKVSTGFGFLPIISSFINLVKTIYDHYVSYTILQLTVRERLIHFWITECFGSFFRARKLGYVQNLTTNMYAMLLWKTVDSEISSANRFEYLRIVGQKICRVDLTRRVSPIKSFMRGTLQITRNDTQIWRKQITPQFKSFTNALVRFQKASHNLTSQQKEYPGQENPILKHKIWGNFLSQLQHL